MSPNAELGRETPWHTILEYFHHPDTKGIITSEASKIIKVIK